MRSKYMNVQFYCVHDRVGQDKIIIYWKPGAPNLGEYMTNHFTSTHHFAMRPTYLHVPTR